MGSFYILSAILLWSSLGVVVRLSGVPVHILIFYSAVVSVLVQGMILTKSQYRGLLRIDKRVLYLLVLGPLILINNFTFFYAYKNTTIANAILTHYIAPVVVAFLALVFLKEQPTKRVLFSIVIASVGLWVLLGVSPRDFLSCFKEPSRDMLGIMSGLFSGLAYAVIVVVTRVFAQNFNPLVMCFLQNVMISVILLPFVRVYPADALWSFLLVGVIHSTLAPILYFKGMSKVKANRAAILGYIEPVGAIIFGVIFFSEYPKIMSLIGGALIVFSGYITLREKNEG
jgi:drug/metabolite transporter (DMT)-like permease